MNQLDLGFAAAPRPSFPTGTIVRAAEVEGDYRWTMRRTWGPGRCVHWNLLNPSDADHQRDDPTTLRMIGFSWRWGFGSMVVTNLYPFVTPKPVMLKAWRAQWRGLDWVSDGRPLDFAYHKSALNAWLHNGDVVRDLIIADPEMVHVAAWGAGADPDDVKDFLDDVSWNYDTIGPDKHRALADMGSRIPVRWMCLGETADGSPIHPLARGVHRVPDDATLRVWREPLPESRPLPGGPL